jgi:hypothetical protein
MNDRKTIHAAEMPDFSKVMANAVSGGAKGSDEHYQQLRRLGALAYQVRASTRAADHYVAQENTADSETASWLISVSVSLATEISGDLDLLARNVKDRPSETGIVHPLQKLRTLAHQYHAAARAADHFLEQDSGEDRGTGSWLIACALGLADKLAGQLEDLASQLKRPGLDGATLNEAGGARKATAANGRGVSA